MDIPEPLLALLIVAIVATVVLALNVLRPLFK